MDGEAFIGEFQLRTELTEDVMAGIGSVGYAVRPSTWGRGYGEQILREMDVVEAENPHEGRHSMR